MYPITTFKWDDITVDLNIVPMTLYRLVLPNFYELDPKTLKLTFCNPNKKNIENKTFQVIEVGNHWY